MPNAFVQLLMTTCLAAAFGSLAMGIVARYPFAQAPGMGLNAFFAFTVVGALGYPWQTALGAVFISGVLFVILSVVGARQAIVRAIPLSLKFAITAGHRRLPGLPRVPQRRHRGGQRGHPGRPGLADATRRRGWRSSGCWSRRC